MARLKDIERLRAVVAAEERAGIKKKSHEWAAADLPPRPSDTSKISFSPDCFEVVGTEEYWVALPWLAGGGALVSQQRQFETEAQARARHPNLRIEPRTRTISRRVRWY